MSFLDRLFADFAWYRRLRGGQWTFDPLAGLSVDLNKVDNLGAHIEWTKRQNMLV